MGSSPVADAYCPDANIAKAQPCYSLDLYMCRKCGHVQLTEVVSPDILFGNYTFRIVHSLGLVEHFQKYSQQMIERLTVKPEAALVIEIGSNDGTLLNFFKTAGCRVLGIDPAPEIAAAANSSGVETVCDYFTSTLAKRLRDRYGKAHCVAANNVFAHADNMADIAIGIRELLADDGFFVFEVSYLVDIVEKFLFDTVYHEHLCYHSIKPLIQFFHKHELELFDVERIASKGGSIRGYVQLRGGRQPVTSAVHELVELETRLGVTDKGYLDKLMAKMSEKKTALHQILSEYRQQGKRICGFGASATVTTLLYTYELAPYLECLLDDNAGKHGCYCPGGQLQVVSPERLHESPPDYVLILAWNYAQPIMRRHASYRAAGGRFIVPLPELTIY